MLIVYIRSIVLYLLLILIIRMMGKRQLGEMEPSEFVVALLLADLAAVPMQDTGIPLLSGVIPLFTVLSIELILSVASYRSVKFRKLLCGKPVILIENGQLLQNNLKKTRLTTDELTEHLREKSIVDLSSVKFAILETNGQISALLYPQYQPVTPSTASQPPEEPELPVTLISCGKVIQENLKVVNITHQQVTALVKRHHLTVSQVFLLNVMQESGRHYIVPMEETS